MANHPYYRGLSLFLIGSLLFFGLGQGCGSLADVNPENCCKDNSFCQHGDKAPVDAKKCCEQNQQSKPKMTTHGDADLAKKTLESAWHESTAFKNGVDGIDLITRDVRFFTLFKPPQLELYKLTSTFLI
jgi:hypothetical protein